MIFQSGSDTYATTQEKKLAFGNADGLIKEWDANWGGNRYHGEPLECIGAHPWASLHQTIGNPDDKKQGAWANRGFVIRAWKAQLGGKSANPWMAEYGRNVHGRKQTSLVDTVPPPGVKRLFPGDFVQATIEHVVVPQFAKDYYGPNQAFRKALSQNENTWRMIHRQASGETFQVKMIMGQLRSMYPGVRVSGTEDGTAQFELSGGLGYIPITIESLPQHRPYTLYIDEVPLDQSIHGNDFWQCDYDDVKDSWSQTFNIPAAPGKTRMIRFTPTHPGK